MFQEIGQDRDRKVWCSCHYVPKLFDGPGTALVDLLFFSEYPSETTRSRIAPAADNQFNSTSDLDRHESLSFDSCSKNFVTGMHFYCAVRKLR